MRILDASQYADYQADDDYSQTPAGGVPHVRKFVQSERFLDLVTSNVIIRAGRLEKNLRTLNQEVTPLPEIWSSSRALL